MTTVLLASRNGSEHLKGRAKLGPGERDKEGIIRRGFRRARHKTGKILLLCGNADDLPTGKLCFVFLMWPLGNLTNECCCDCHYRLRRPLFFSFLGFSKSYLRLILATGPLLVLNRPSRQMSELAQGNSAQLGSTRVASSREKKVAAAWRASYSTNYYRRSCDLDSFSRSQGVLIAAELAVLCSVLYAT